MTKAPAMRWRGDGILCAVLPHGETGAVVRVLTSDQGLLAGYVRGGASRRLRPTLIPGNSVAMEWHARVEEQLGTATLDLRRARTGIMLGRPGQTRALEWATVLVATALPERLPLPHVHDGLAGLLDVLELGDDPLLWAATLVRFELLLLGALGFGLDLSCCAATGTRNDLAYVSPRSAQAVSRAAGAPYADRLLPLPAFLSPGNNAAPDWPAVAAGFRLSGHFLARAVLTERAARILETRQRLIAMLPQPADP